MDCANHYHKTTMSSSQVVSHGRTRAAAHRSLHRALSSPLQPPIRGILAGTRLRRPSSTPHRPLSPVGPAQMAMEKVECAHAVDRVRPVEHLHRGSIAEAQQVVPAPGPGVLVGHPLVRSHAVVVPALDHEGTRTDQPAHLRVVEGVGEIELGFSRSASRSGRPPAALASTLPGAVVAPVLRGRLRRALPRLDRRRRGAQYIRRDAAQALRCQRQHSLRVDRLGNALAEPGARRPGRRPSGHASGIASGPQSPGPVVVCGPYVTRGAAREGFATHQEEVLR